MTKHTLPADLTEIEALTLLHTLAVADPDYPMVAQQLAPLALVALPSDEQAAVARAALEVLGEDPQHAAAMVALLNQPPQRFDAGLLSASLLVAVVFLLRTHIRLEGKTRGLTFTIEHKPADSQLLTALLNKLASLLPTGSQG